MKKSLLLLCACMTATPAFALDGMYAEYGKADVSVISSPAQAKLYRVGAMWNWDRTWLNGGYWHLTGFWDVSLAQWHGEKPGADNQTVTDLGIMPVFRLTPMDRTGITPYFEAGVLGIHLISPTFLYTGRRFSTAFQFGNIIGFGVRMGAQHQFELGVRFQHESNANIKLPNNGMDFDILHIAYWF